jgi:hypothetical protein
MDPDTDGRKEQTSEESEAVDWIHLAQDSDWYLPLKITIMEFPFTQKA